MTDITEEGRRDGRLLVIGGAENRTCGTGPLKEFVSLAGADESRIVVVTTATEKPEQVAAEYARVFHRLGVSSVTELRLPHRAVADSQDSLDVLRKATGVLFSGGDQSRIRSLVGSKANALLRRRLTADGLVIAGTSAGATAMGRWMILGGDGHEVAASTVRIGPGLGLLDDVLIDMHFAERGRLPRLLSGIALDTLRLGVGIDEDTAIVVREGRFEVIGSGVVTIVDADQATVGYAECDDDPMALFDVRLHLLPAGCWFDMEQRKPWFGPVPAAEE
ncbi:cyanophycinase [Actinoallomurus rhizosphaericola]|uniref:cyanophycinase n=1 Tax=Actinoallomurus rhizosphaericola TaxID=2952536 RepID=UPI002093DD2E|nr:cyanophycinase [Actinoallomurus rhizosphaericola]MCO5998516.1 cyanophycinase [Actinoallomurus rhizosphaericola]